MKQHTRVVRDYNQLAEVSGLLAEHFLSGNPYPVQLTIKRHHLTRSLEQNATFHMWFGEIAEATGHTMEEVKEALKQEFCPRAPGPANTTRVKGTSELTMEEAMLFMEQVQAWAAGFGIGLTEPVGQ